MDGLTLYLSHACDKLCSRTIVLLSYNISPLCDVAQTSDCGVFLFLTLNISPLCDVAQTSDCGMHCLYFLLQALYVVSPRRPTVALLFCIFLSRSLSDTRLAPVLLFRIFRSRSLSDTRLAPVLLFCSFRSRRHSDPRLAPSIYYLYV